jgi:hypothetical protein
MTQGMTDLRSAAAQAGRRGIMKIRRSIVAAGAAVVLSGTGALVLPAVASAHSTTHTLKFTAVTNKSINFSKTNFGNQETDVNSTGKTIGFDDVNFTITGPNTGKGRVALDIKGGFLYGAIATTNGGKTFTGKVTGGTGPYAGATGTITAKGITRNKTAVTIIYS